MSRPRLIALVLLLLVVVGLAYVATRPDHSETLLDESLNSPAPSTETGNFSPQENQFGAGTAPAAGNPATPTSSPSVNLNEPVSETWAISETLPETSNSTAALPVTHG